MTVWTVPATILRVVDGDTLEVLLDLGWRITLKTKVRLAGCNAPEMSTAEGVAARKWAESVLISGYDAAGVAVFRPITVVSHSLDKYGRVLGTVLFTLAGDIGQHSLGAELLDSGHAVPMG